MSFRRSRLNLAIRPVHRIKHVFDSQFALAAGTAGNQTIVTTVDAPVLANTAECETGSKINGFFITCEIYGTSSAALSNAYFILFKNPGGNIANPAPNTVGSNDNKRYVIHQEMVMLQKVDTSNPRTLFKGVVAVPRHLRRNGPNDLWRVGVLTPGVSADVCLQVHYKEFR